MSSYDEHLPHAFPYCVLLDIDTATEIIQFLIKTRPGIPSGSSFAVTSDIFSSDETKRKLWLSRVSLELLPAKFYEKIVGQEWLSKKP